MKEPWTPIINNIVKNNVSLLNIFLWVGNIYGSA